MRQWLPPTRVAATIECKTLSKPGASVPNKWRSVSFIEKT
ncbi:MAG: hypothetical protein JWP36_1164 [Paucimonas sp.]|nr:hypothetical protein [Paucimonas sp.]